MCPCPMLFPLLPAPLQFLLAVSESSLCAGQRCPHTHTPLTPPQQSNIPYWPTPPPRWGHFEISFFPWKHSWNLCESLVQWTRHAVFVEDMINDFIWNDECFLETLHKFKKPHFAAVFYRQSLMRCRTNFKDAITHHFKSNLNSLGQGFPNCDARPGATECARWQGQWWI